MVLMLPMNSVHELDWNLWVVLHQLLETGSVTEAARRLGRTQSAVSHSLGALRTAFGDPLFVRAGARFEPTPRARALAEPVRALVQHATQAFTPPKAFVPAELQRVFPLFLSDYAQLVLLPGLLSALRAQAPGVTLDVHFRSDAVATLFSDLGTGRVELMVAPVQDAPSGVVRQRLFGDKNVCALRQGHPALKRFTAERFAALPHLQVSARGLGPDFIDEALARKGLSRRVAVRVPHFAAAPFLVAESDAVAVVPERLARAWRRHPGLRFVEPPLPLPTFAMAQYFPEALRSDPAHAWLRRLVFEVAGA